MARFNGEIIAIGAVYPVVGAMEGIAGKNYAALLIVDCMARFAICLLAVDTKAATLISIFINDWIRPSGKPDVSSWTPDLLACLALGGANSATRTSFS